MRTFNLISATLLTLMHAGVMAQTGEAAVTRGALLYQNHCAACHTEQMHWREQRQARDWNSLRALVRRWQGEARVSWNDADIEAVTRHLNDTIYRFPAPAEIASAARPTGGE
jgi:mono/diheme cytochrome c family protein